MLASEASSRRPPRLCVARAGLAYWNMHAAADFAQQRTLFEYYLQMSELLAVRTQAAFNHTGLYVTETKTLFGTYDPCDYGGSDATGGARDPSLSFGYQQSRWIRFDFGGDAGLPELCGRSVEEEGTRLRQRAAIPRARRRGMPLTRMQLSQPAPR